MNYAPDLVPRHPDGVARIVLMGRISTPGQKLEAIEASYDYMDRFIRPLWRGSMEVRKLGEQASGMLTDRDTLNQAYALIESEWADAVGAEDLSRVFRNPRWIYAFVQDCVDAGVRVIAPGDNLDTAVEGWENALATAALRHGLHIPDTRRRVNRSADHSFDSGGQVFKVRMGYRKLTKEQAETGEFGPRGSRIGRLDEYKSVYDTLREMVLAGKRPEHLLKWATENGVKPGPYVKSGRLTAPLLIDTLRDPILRGLRRHRVTRYVQKYGTGKHVRTKNPQPATKLVPELAFMTKEQWDAMQAVMDRWDTRDDRPSGPDHPRNRVPRRKTLCPLQHLGCIICGGIAYPTGPDTLKCKNGLGRGDRPCWCHVEVIGERCRVALIDAVLSRLNAVPSSKAAMLDATWGMLQEQRRRGGNDIALLDAEIKRLNKEAAHLTAAIRKGGKLAFLVEQATALQNQIDELETSREEAQRAERECRGAATREELDVDPRATLLELARTSFEFADLMRLIFPRFVIQPLQALDTRQVRPRGLLTLDLAALVREHGGEVPESCKPREIVVDLFDPPEHIKHLSRIVEKRKAKIDKAEKVTLDILAAETGVNRMTVKRALKYATLMEAEGLSEPYRVLTEKPTNASRWKHRKGTDGQDASAPLEKAG